MAQNASAMLARTGLVGDILDIDIAEKIAEEIGYSWDSSCYL